MTRLEQSAMPEAADWRNISREADSGKPSPLEVLERMARRRFQDPKPKREGDWWYIRPWRDEVVAGNAMRRRVRIKLCPATMSYREAQKEAAERLRSINQGTEASAGSIATLKEYVTTTYIPIDLPALAKPVQDCYAGVIRRHIEPDLGAKCFRELTPLALRRYFANLASRGVAYPTIVKMRDALSSVLRSAEENGFIAKNPLKGVRLPKDRRPRRRKETITPEQFRKMVELMPEPYSTMVFVAVWTGLRVSELLALKWRCVHANSITVEERFCRGDWSAPKTEGSAATIGVEPWVIERIQSLKKLTVEVQAGKLPRAKRCSLRSHKLVKRGDPDALVFQSVRDGKPMRDGNVLRRFIKPAAKAAGVPFVDWRCLRRSHATWLIRSGADPKSVQGQMRHARITTTLDIYAQIVDEGQQQALHHLAAYAKVAVPDAVPIVPIIQ